MNNTLNKITYNPLNEIIYSIPKHVKFLLNNLKV